MTAPYSGGIEAFKAVYDALVEAISDVVSGVPVRKFAQVQPGYPKYPLIEVVPETLEFIEDRMLSKFSIRVAFTIVIALPAKTGSNEAIFTMLSSVLDAVAGLEDYLIAVRGIDFNEDMLSTPAIHACSIHVEVEADV